jgi:hypothetical protein
LRLPIRVLALCRAVDKYCCAPAPDPRFDKIAGNLVPDHVFDAFLHIVEAANPDHGEAEEIRMIQSFAADFRVEAFLPGQNDRPSPEHADRDTPDVSPEESKGFSDAPLVRPERALDDAPRALFVKRSSEALFQ